MVVIDELRNNVSVKTASVLFDMICAEPTYRADGFSTATRGVLDEYSLELGLVALQDLNILSVPQTAVKRGSVHFWRRALAHGWKQFLPLNFAKVESARAAATAALNSKANEASQKQKLFDAEITLKEAEIARSRAEAARAQAETDRTKAEAAQKQAEFAEEAALKKKLLNIEIAQKQEEAAQKKKLFDIELAQKQKQFEIRSAKKSASK